MSYPCTLETLLLRPLVLLNVYPREEFLWCLFSLISSNLYQWCVNSQKKKKVSCLYKKTWTLRGISSYILLLGGSRKPKGKSFWVFPGIESDGRIDTRTLVFPLGPTSMRSWYEIKTIYGRRNVEKEKDKHRGGGSSPRVIFHRHSTIPLDSLLTLLRVTTSPLTLIVYRVYV